MTINGFEPTRYVLAQGTLQATKANFVLLAKKKKNGLELAPYTASRL